MTDTREVSHRPVENADPRRWYALGLLCTASFLVILDAQIVTVAVPSIQHDLGLTSSGVQWVLSGYALAFGGLLLLGGRAADLFGRRRIFMTGVALFATTSLVCGLAWTPAVLLGARVMQGASAAMMAPSAMAIMVATFAEGHERNRALGVNGAMAAAGGSAGALAGGPLTQGLGWQWIFLLNVPIGIAMFVLSPVLLRRHKPEPWRAGRPLVPLRIFRSRTLVGGNLVTLTAAVGAYGQGLLTALYAQEVLGYSPAQFGLMTAVVPVTAVIASEISQRMVTRFGFRVVAAVSMSLMAAGFLLLTQVSANGSYAADLLPGLLLIGPGLGSATVAASIAAVSGVAEQEVGLASGISNTSFQIGGAFGVAMLTTVAAIRTDLTSGYRLAFAVAAGVCLLGMLAATTLLRRSAPPPADGIRA